MNADERVIADVGRPGHFRYESGHHGDLWLDLDALLADARRLSDWAAQLARQVSEWRPAIVAGPLTGGAFVAQFVAADLGVEFLFVERWTEAGGARYAVPAGRRPALAGRRIALVDDAVNAGSAIRASLADVIACGGLPVGLASLIALGDAATRIGRETALPFASLFSLERRMWRPEECPLCRSGAPMDSPEQTGG